MMNTLSKTIEYIKKSKKPTRLRNTFHFDVPCGWLNDPCGCIYAYGTNHIFYQYYPFAAHNGKGLMYWGHATTDDFIRYRDLPPVLAPDHDYDKSGCWTGGSFIFNEKMYIMYTGCFDYKNHQCLAVSEDKGLTFKKVENNPIIPLSLIPENGFIYSFRDPNIVIKDDALYVLIGAKDTKNDCGSVLLYKSSDLTKWNYLGTLLEVNLMQDPGICECPNYCKIGNSDVIVTSLNCIKTYGKYHRNFASTMAYVGQLDFEKASFDKESEYILDYGFDYYAPQVIRQKDRNVLVGWMQMWEITYPTAKYGWVGSLTIGRELNIVDKKLKITPVKELDNYCIFIKKEQAFDVVFDKKPSRIKLEKKKEDGPILSIYNSRNKVTLSYNQESNELVLARSGNVPKSLSPLQENMTERFCPLNNDKNISFNIIIDTSSLEIFVNNGDSVMTSNVYFKKGKIKLFGKVKYELYSIKGPTK